MIIDPTDETTKPDGRQSVGAWLAGDGVPLEPRFKAVTADRPIGDLHVETQELDLLRTESLLDTQQDEALELIAEYDAQLSAEREQHTATQATYMVTAYVIMT